MSNWNERVDKAITEVGGALPGSHAGIDIARAIQIGLETLKEPEPKSVPMQRSDIYPMGKSQPAQIDCRIVGCKYHVNSECTNLSPAITLNPDGTFVCWSRDEMEFKEGDWVVFEPTGHLYKLEDPAGRSTHFHLYSVGHGTLRQDLCRHATLEEKFSPGALVRHHEDDVKIEGRVQNFVKNQVRIIGAGSMSFYPKTVTLLEPAPKEKGGEK